MTARQKYPVEAPHRPGELPKDDSSGEILLTPKQCAKKLNFTERYVRSLARNKEIPSIKIGKYIRFIKADIVKWLKRRRT